MVVATHQPIFLPWPGFFFKALQADALVLLDRVQFPQGRGWLHRNRLKSDQGDHWLRVPIWKAGAARRPLATSRSVTTRTGVPGTSGASGSCTRTHRTFSHT
jgi:hypothetical protein